VGGGREKRHTEVSGRSGRWKGNWHTEGKTESIDVEKGCKGRSVRDTESWRFTTGWTAGLRIGELRLNVGGLVVSGFDDKKTKKGGSGGDEKTKNDEFPRGIAPESLSLPVARKEEGNRGLFTWFWWYVPSTEVLVYN
jgi:hypothetical protein